MARPGQRVTGHAGKGGGVGSNQYQTRGTSRAGEKRQAPERGYGEAPPAVREWAHKRFKNPEHAKAFSRWFGDSKVVDANGHPLEIHKGVLKTNWRTEQPITEIKSTNGPWAGFFSDSKDVADRFATRYGSAKGNAHTVTGYAKISRPYVLDATGKNAKEFQFDKLVDMKGGPRVVATPEALEIINSGKYDGIVIKHTNDEGTVFVPFDSHQFKASTNRGTFSKKRGEFNLSIDAIPTLHINRTLNPRSSPTPPDIPNADEIADETIGYLATVLAEIQDRLLAGQPFGDVAAKLDQLVAQAELSSWIAGAVGVWHDSRKPRLYTLDALGGLPTKRFPWIEEAARWLMDRNVYSAQEIQAQARGEFEPRWKSLEAATKLRDEIANGFTVGESFEEFYARIKSKVDATKPELQNAFRTSTHQAYIHGTATTLEKPLVKLQFPFVLYRSAHDTRTRDTHRPLDGLLFEIGSPAYAIMRRALNDFNCRCGLTSQTEADATKKKLRPVQVDDLPAEVLEKYGRP